MFSRLKTWSKDKQLLPRLNGEIDGWYPRLGGITRGSGFAVGPGYRTPFAGDAFLLDLSGAISMKGYTSLDARLRWWRAIDDRLELWSEFRMEDFPEEDFYGTGMNTAEAARSSYDFDSTDLRVRAQYRARPWLRLHVVVGYRHPDVGSGTDSNYPSTEDVFTEAEAPGLFAQPNFMHTTFGAEIDYRDSPGDTASGGYYRTSFMRANDVTLNEYDFRRFDLHAAQYVPLTPGKAHVLSGRVGTSLVNNTDGNRVPFYFLPYVGGSDTIRGLREFRFKDENAIWASGEYKWRATKFLSFSVFADAGKVTSDWKDLDFRELRAGYGAGVALHAAKQTIFRVDAGSGAGEGWQVFIKVRPQF